SDERGEFAVPAGAAGPFTVQVSHAQHPRSVVADVDPGDDVRVTLASGGVLEGELRADRGVVPRGARVWLDDAAGERHAATVDGGGRFRIGGCAPGAATLGAQAPGFLPIKAVVDLPPADRPGEVLLRDVRITFVEAGSVAGRVTD